MNNELKFFHIISSTMLFSLLLLTLNKIDIIIRIRDYEINYIHEFNIFTWIFMLCIYLYDFRYYLYLFMLLIYLYLCSLIN